MTQQKQLILPKTAKFKVFKCGIY